MPILFLPRALLTLLSLAILAGAGYLAWLWLDGYEVVSADGLYHRVHSPAWFLYVALGMGAWSLLGRFVVLLFIPAGKDEPGEERGSPRTVEAPDGARLRVDTFPNPGRPTIILTHGWGLNATAWRYTNKALGGRFGLMTWDLPGLGGSSPPKSGPITLDGFARALGAVVQAAPAGPVVLVGHSIGGMTSQTFWRACPKSLTDRVVGMVLVDTTYENPINTMWLSGLWRVLRWPVIEPMCWASIALSPLLWLCNWQSYLCGSAQLAMRLTGFGKFATRQQVDFTARLACQGSPSIQARGNLAMFRWSMREALPGISVPTLVLGGSADIVTLPSANSAIARAVNDGQYQQIEGCGHMGFMESRRYDKAILDFAEQACTPPAAA